MIHITPRTRGHTSAAPRAGRPSRVVHTPRCTLRLARAAPSVAPSVAPRPRLASPAPRPLPLRARAVPHPRRAAPHCAESPDALSRAHATPRVGALVVGGGALGCRGGLNGCSVAVQVGARRGASVYSEALWRRRPLLRRPAKGRHNSKQQANWVTRLWD